MFGLLIQMLALGVRSLHEEPANCSLRICVFLYRVNMDKRVTLKNKMENSAEENVIQWMGTADVKTVFRSL